MRIVEKHSGALTDFEVFRLLDEEKRHAASERQLLSGGRRTAPHVALAAQRIVSAVREGLMRYLSSSPAYVQTEAHIVDFLERTADLGLNAAELLMCINLRPAQRVELFVVIDACDQRFTADQVDALLKACIDCLPEPPARQTDAELVGDDAERAALSDK
ncbi:hypothetical protein KFE25_005341 [Diacronema lutheri]|uniref:DNA-directed RNA polymerase III subunit RPC9 n=1 Tax=Diacronema lutheri TaxID=2081491 RepID=A0A8J6CC66_DIALT|nr:hypothetical protein KFE25_005341 [Diacronema lutheri]|mmetsp:Transcript_15767/g.49041  ORF Transcript_15767/g.49041 Transcript_15767/m.49041 type:complete len:160 (-) Transcript_15767:382-861(-)